MEQNPQNPHFTLNFMMKSLKSEIINSDRLKNILFCQLINKTFQFDQ